MLVEKVTIIGVGLLGGSLAASLKRTGCASEITGVDTPDVLTKALEMGIIDKTHQNPEEGVRGADMVVLATPISSILTLIPHLASHFKPGALVTDVGSTKVEIIKAAQKYLPETVCFIGGHPMTGSERSGVTSADSFLFENAVYVLTPLQAHLQKIPIPEDLQESSWPWFTRLCKIIQKIGGRVLVLDPVSHDEIVAAVSHLPYLLSVSLVNLIADLQAKHPNLLQLAAGGFRDLTRVASGSTKMWVDICQSNKSQILPLIDLLIQHLQTLKSLISEENVLSKLERARQVRSTIPYSNKGLLEPLHEVRLVAKDEPGVLATLTRVIAEAGINISDMEILKIREGEGGTIRLAFRLRSDAIQAVELLKHAGFNARLQD